MFCFAFVVIGDGLRDCCLLDVFNSVARYFLFFDFVFCV